MQAGVVGKGSTIIRSNGIEAICHQNNPSNDVKYITHMQSVLIKNYGSVHKKEEERDLVKIIWHP